ncbi:hypothetical protein FRC06_007479 [Ceratobasidium sp. 370]|nr:hypothetical protein FRC06_007479 [Ceratobasidium sp. 370]
MRLAAFFLAAPVVLQLVAADPRPTPTPNHARRALERWAFERQLPTGGASSAAPGGNSQTEKESSTTPTTSTTPTSTSTTPTSTSTSSSEAETTTSRSTADPQTTSTREQSSASSTSTSQAQSQSSAAPSSQTHTTAPVVLSTPSPTSSQLVTTNDQGVTFTSIVVLTRPASAVASPSSTSDDSSDKPIPKGTIIGLAVTGSIAVLIIILLIVWKLTNKRFSDLDDIGDDAIKWPELNKDSAAMTPLPARPTGRSGVETTALDDFDAQSSAAHSTADLTGTHYQPYSDDPGYGTRPQYYDPYGGAPGVARPYASPPGSHDGDHKNWGGPADAQGYADPHQQYYDAPARGPSPGPNMAYGDSLARGTSPGPNMAYADPTGRTASPAPGYGGYPAGYGADQSMGGRRSPGPNLAYGGSQNDHAVVDAYGRQSPAPGMGYGGRAASPGPNAAYGQAGYR